MRDALARRNYVLQQMAENGYILPADVLLDLHERCAVRKRADRGIAHFDANVLRDGFGERTVGRAAKNFHRRSVVSGKINATILWWRQDC